MRILTLLLGSVLAAGSPPPAGTLTHPPELLEFVPAEYPADAAAAGVEGSVVLAIVISAEGEVTEARVLDPGPHPGFAPAALHAVVQFRFRPAEIDGVPAAVEIQYRYDFVMKHPEPSAPSEAPIALMGRVVERGTGSPVVGATVEATGASVETGKDGEFELRGIAPGDVTVRVVSPEHQPLALVERIEKDKVREVTFRLTRRHYDPYEAVVRGQRDESEVSVYPLSTEEVRTVPGSQGDTLKVIQNLPGVARSPFGIGLLVVRGSEPSETPVLVDGVPIPQLFHFGGLTSVLNADVVDTTDFYPGNYASRYGRGLGGVVELHTKEPKKEWHGAAQVDLYDGRAEEEGPVGGGSMYAAVRRSWVDGVLAIVLPKADPQAANDLRVAPRYYDWQAKYSHALLGGQGSLFAFGSNDELEYVQPQDQPGRPSFYLSTVFWRVGASHRALIGDATNELVISAGRDSQNVLSGGTFGLLIQSDQYTLRDRLTRRITPTLSLEGGVDVLAGSVFYSVYAPPIPPPGSLSTGGFGSPGTVVGETARGFWVDPAAWVEADWRALPRLRFVAGLRADSYERYGIWKGWLDPRASAFIDAAPGTVLVAAAGLYGSAPQPQETTRVFGNPNLDPQRSLQLSVGVRQDLPFATKLELTAFYKDLWSLAVPTAALALDGRALNYSNAGIGQTIGLELLLKRELAHGLYGWLSYTLSRALRRDDPTAPYYPAWHPFQYDQTHVLALVASYRLPREWIIGTRLRYVTGNPATPYVGSVLDSDTGRFQCVPGRPYSSRLPPFFQADARVDKRWVFERWMLSTYLDVQNVTNRQNAEFQFPNYDCSQTVAVPSLPLFPTLGVRAEW